MKHFTLFLCSILVWSQPSRGEDPTNQQKLAIKDADSALRAKDWDSCSAVAVGSGYSFALQTKTAHPVLAEYFQRVLIFAGTDRDGRLSGSLQLQMNTGGRTQILIYRHIDETGKVTHISCEDRFGVQTFRLNDPDFQDAPNTTKKEYLGIISGEAYPLKFFPAIVLPEVAARKKIK